MRKYSIDICRALACIMVLLGHVLIMFIGEDPTTTTWAISNYFHTALHFAVNPFFMISGALLLGREKMNIRKHMKRTLHFLILYFIWGFMLSFLDNRFWHVWYNDASLSQLIFGSYYHLWYLSAMILCYAFLPLLHSAIHKTGLDIKYCFGLIVFTVLVVNTEYLPNKPLWLELLLQNFDLAYLKYLVYFFLGWWLSQRKLSAKEFGLLTLASFVAVTIYAWLNRRYSISIGAPSGLFYDFLSPAMVLLTSLVFSLCMYVKSVPKCLMGIMDEFLACSFGIYLIHVPIITMIKASGFDLARYSMVVLAPITFVLLLLGTFAIVFVLRRIPLVKKLVT